MVHGVLYMDVEIGYMIDANTTIPHEARIGYKTRGLLMTGVTDLSCDAGNSHPDGDINNNCIYINCEGSFHERVTIVV